MTMPGMCFFETIREPEVAELLSVWRNIHPEMGILALVAESDRATNVPFLQALCSRMNVPLCGAIFPALLFQNRFHAKGCVLARFDTMPYTNLYEPLKPSDPQSSEIIEGMVQDITSRLDRPRSSSLFMIFDQMVVNIATILDELYLKLADRVHYLGVNAGSETFRPMPCLFDTTRLVQDGALLMLLPDHPGAVVEHCYAAPERMISATATEGNRIITIDWRPAFEVYREMMEAEYGVKIDRDNFYQYAVHFPFGIVRSNNEIIVRIPVALEKDGSLFCVGEVPPNAVLTLLRGPAAGSLETVDRIEQGLRGLHRDLSDAFILTFYCAGRRMHLGEQAHIEVRELQKRMGAAQLAGALSLGEIGQARQWGYPLFHNGALLCCTWGQP